MKSTANGDMNAIGTITCGRAGVRSQLDQSAALWMTCCPTSTRNTLTITLSSSVTSLIEALIAQG